jgi:aquaporin Z
MRRYAVETIGTFFLVLVITTTVLLQVGPAPIAIAAVLTVMIFAGGHVSGAHYNPAVTVALAVRNRFAWRDVPAYCIAQTLGAVGGALVGRYLLAGRPAEEAFTAGGKALAAATVAELLVTFALAYVVLNVATSKNTAGNSFYGLAIGGTVLAGALTVGGISGGVFNPAVAVGVAGAGLVDWTLVPVYVACQIAAGALAGLTFRALNRDDVAEPAPEAPAASTQLAQVLSGVEALTTAFQGLPDQRDSAAVAQTAPGAVLSHSVR